MTDDASGDDSENPASDPLNWPPSRGGGVDDDGADGDAEDDSADGYADDDDAGTGSVDGSDRGIDSGSDAGAADATADFDPSPHDSDRSRDVADDSDGGSIDDAGSGSVDDSGSGSVDDADRGSVDDPTDAPLGDLASSVRNRRDRDREPVDEGLFEEQDVTPIDSDVVWDRLEADEAGDPDTAATGREERVVEKDSYCESCPYFSSPPDVSCSHEGTSILELVDVDHFRVADCPKVEETERLEQL